MRKEDGQSGVRRSRCRVILLKCSPLVELTLGPIPIGSGGPTTYQRLAKHIIPERHSSCHSAQLSSWGGAQHIPSHTVQQLRALGTRAAQVRNMSHAPSVRYITADVSCEP